MDRAMQERLVGATILVLIAVLLIPWLLDGGTQTVGEHSSERELILPGSSASGTETRVISLDAANRGGSVKAPPQVETRTVKDVDAVSVDSQFATTDLSNATANQNNVAATLGESATSEQSPPTVSASLPNESAQSAAHEGDTATVASSLPSPNASNAPAASTTQTVTAKVATQPEQQGDKNDPAKPDRTPSENSPPATFSTPMPTTPTPTPATAATELGWAVQVGSFARQENADRLADRLRDKKYKAFVMRNVVEGRVRFRVRVGPVKERVEAELLAAALTEDRQPVKVLRHP